MAYISVLSNWTFLITYTVDIGCLNVSRNPKRGDFPQNLTSYSNVTNKIAKLAKLRSENLIIIILLVLNVIGLTNTSIGLKTRIMTHRSSLKLI